MTAIKAPGSPNNRRHRLSGEEDVRIMEKEDGKEEGAGGGGRKEELKKLSLCFTIILCAHLSNHRHEVTLCG